MSALTTADVAELRKCNRVNAWRWMLRLQKKYGPDVVRREGPKRLVIDREILERILAGKLPPIDPRIAHRLGDLEASQRDQDRRLDSLARKLSAFALLGVGS